MCLTSGRASAIFRTRLTIVTIFIKPKFQSIRLNSIQQNYAAATISLLINKNESRTKCNSIKEQPKNITKQDSLTKSYNSKQFMDSNMPCLERSKFLAQNNSNLKNNSQIYSTSRSFSLQSTQPSSVKKSSSEPSSNEVKPQEQASKEIKPQEPTSKEVKPQAPPSNKVEPQSQPPSMDVKPSKTERLKMAFTEYGPTIMALHLAMSIISFAGFYALLSGGIDVNPLLKFFGVSSSAMSEKLTTGSAFVVALAVHKILAPIRISMTLGVTPLVVRYMRSKGLMKAKTKTL